jgi:hypothetical protein
VGNRIMSRWDLEAILNRELHKHSACAPCRFVGFDTWNGEDAIFDHILVEGNGVPETVYGPMAEKIIAEAKCTYEGVDVE